PNSGPLARGHARCASKLRVVLEKAISAARKSGPLLLCDADLRSCTGKCMSGDLPAHAIGNERMHRQFLSQFLETIEGHFCARRGHDRISCVDGETIFHLSEATGRSE